MRLPSRSFGDLMCLLVDEDEAVPEHPRGEHRNGDERALSGDEARDVFGAGEFRGVEFQSRRHAVENVARVVVDQEVEIDALDLHLAGVERQHAVVEPAGESQRQLGHRSSVARGSALVAGITTFGADPAKGACDAALRLAARVAHANIKPSRRHRLPERRKRHEVDHDADPLCRGHVALRHDGCTIGRRRGSGAEEDQRRPSVAHRAELAELHCR